MTVWYVYTLQLPQLEQVGVTMDDTVSPNVRQ